METSQIWSECLPSAHWVPRKQFVLYSNLYRKLVKRAMPVKISVGEVAGWQFSNDQARPGQSSQDWQLRTENLDNCRCWGNLLSGDSQKNCCGQQSETIIPQSTPIASISQLTSDQSPGWVSWLIPETKLSQRWWLKQRAVSSEQWAVSSIWSREEASVRNERGWARPEGDNDLVRPDNWSSNKNYQ